MAKMIYTQAVRPEAAIGWLVSEVLNLKRANEEMTKRIERLEQAVYSEEEMDSDLA